MPDDSPEFWKQSPADDPAPDETGGDVPAGDAGLYIAPKDQLPTQGMTIGKLIEHFERTDPDLADTTRSLTTRPLFPLDALAELRSNPIAMASLGMSEALNKQIMQAISPLSDAIQMRAGMLVGTAHEVLGGLGTMFGGVDQESINKLIHGPAFGIDLSSLADTWRAAMKEAAARDRRNRDRAPEHLHEQHVRDVMGNVDFAAFLNAQRDDDTPDDDALMAQLTALIHDPAHIELRQSITRELLYIAWVDTARQYSFDGDDSIPLEWDDEETGEPRSYTFTAQDVTDVLLENLQALDNWHVFSGQYIERDILAGFVEQATAHAAASPVAPLVFNSDGLGHMLSDGASFNIWRSMNAQHEWQRNDAGRPVITYQGRGVKGGLGFAEHVNIAAALDAVNKLGGVAPDAFLAIAMLAFQRRHENQLWDDPALYITTDTLLDALGYQKHNRAYRREDRQEVTQAVAQLWSLWVWGTRTDKRGRPHPYSGPVLVIKDIEPLAGARLKITRPLTPADTEHIGAWRLYLGSWADDILAEKNPWSAIIMRQLMDYTRKHQLHIRRLGFVLPIAFRIRMDKGTWEQPFTIADLLRDAAIPTDAKQPGRMLKDFTEALQTLAADGITGTPRYADGRAITDIPEDRTKGWYQRFLADRVIVPPPDSIRAIYESSKQRQPRRRSPRKLAG